jgi:hypothetical protein
MRIKGRTSLCDPLRKLFSITFSVLKSCFWVQEEHAPEADGISEYIDGNGGDILPSIDEVGSSIIIVSHGRSLNKFLALVH